MLLLPHIMLPAQPGEAATEHCTMPAVGHVNRCDRLYSICLLMCAHVLDSKARLEPDDWYVLRLLVEFLHIIECACETRLNLVPKIQELQSIDCNILMIRLTDDVG